MRGPDERGFKLVKLMRVLAAAAVLSFMGAGAAQAAGSLNPGSGNLGFTMMVGYNASYIDYKETAEYRGAIDRDYGYLNGIDAEIRFESGLVWTRFAADYSWTHNSTYDGALWDGTPVKASNHERINLYEGDIGFKALNVKTSTLTPYVGIGYRLWHRGMDEPPNYIEKYSWYFAAIGINYVWRIDRSTFGLDVAAHIPFDMKLATNFAGQAPEFSGNLKKRVGFEVRLPFTYDFCRNRANSRRAFLFLTPYYQYWAIGASEPVTINLAGTPTPVMEPDSRTDIYGADAGAGVNF